MTTNAPTNKKPAYIGYVVTKRGDKSYWTRIGTMWGPNKAGGYNSEVIANPIDGKIVWMPPKQQPDGDELPTEE
jgi:hypothetical protein